MNPAWKLFGRWLRMRKRVLRWRRATGINPPDTEAPLRAELFSAEQMQAHGFHLASQHQLSAQRGPDRLLGRLGENAAVLDDTCALLTRLVREDIRTTPAGEWLLDNAYLVEEQVRTARRHLPKGYSRELPSLANGPSAGMPRVYDLAMEAIAHGDGRIDARELSRFVNAYQSVTPLKLGELWAIPIMLRLALIENLRRIAVGILRDGQDHQLAAQWSARLNETATSEPRDLVLVVADLARSQPPLSGAFVAELTRQVHGRSAPLAMPLQWVEHWVATAGHRVEDLVRIQGQQQAADQVSISNSIGSLRLLANLDWRAFVESLSKVEQTLREDPDGTYARMDFRTRDSYRHVVERLARSSGADEPAVAHTVVELAREHTRIDPLTQRADVRGHVGYYLVDEGLAEARSAIAGLPGARRPRGHGMRRLPLPLYLAPIALIAALFSVALLSELGLVGLPLALLVGVGLLGAIAYSELGIALVNWAATLLVQPRPLPRMDYSEGLPEPARTLVVVPSMMGSVAGIEALIEGLEVRYLANRDGQLRFALLTDFLDADREQLPGDAALVDAAVAGIQALNQRHAGDGGDGFFLFHRPRRFNQRERCWMGAERKRGKLAALNHLLRGGGSAPFQAVVGDLDALAHTRYVITLDTDTRLPRDSAREFVATLDHPLNRARFDPDKRRVVRGYGILQPSLGSSMGDRRPSRYARVVGSEPGIDPYTRTVSDVYQDLFGEGSYFGKGIYDIDAFEYALEGRFPDNQVLSHDLLEGCYARAGLVSDVRLYEDPPSRYAADVKRRHRWIRGDWQLLPWLLPWVPRLDGSREANPLSWLSRGKLADNLRRSLVPAATTLLLVLGWALLPAPLAFTLWVLCVPLLPLMVPVLGELLSIPPDMDPETHLVHVGQSALRQLERGAVGVACLPHAMAVNLGAIAVTLWRLGVSRRRLLQWNPSSEVERQLSGASAELRSMAFAPVFAMAVTVLLWQSNPAALWTAAPVLLAWFASPALMGWLGRAPPVRRTALATPQRRFLGALARRTWAFFETQVHAGGHWLPPDNLQEHPAPVVAERTSPTNIGLSLLANLAALDFGYLQPTALLDRTANCLDTLKQLPRHRGHLYNWYDTRTLEPLPPRYVSSVDSGNLAGHLLVLRQGLLALVDAPLLAQATFNGLRDTLEVLQAEWPAARRDASAETGTPAPLREFGTRLAQARAAGTGSAEAARVAVAGLLEQAREIAAQWPAPPAQGVAADARHWPEALLEACQSAAQVLADAPADGPMHSPAQLAALPGDAGSRGRALVERIQALAHEAGQFSLMDFGFLYDRDRHLLSIGYNVDERRLDDGHYDLLASEARLGNFVAIAQGQLPQESWFALGRLLTEVGGHATLLSWSGSMFEYLMPQLVMPSYPETLLDQTARHAVMAQMRHGQQHGVPWGVSESGYSAVDTRMNYQYRAFGTPGLGLKRGLGEELVVAPYASMMALMVAPEAACQNLQRLEAMGAGGRFGLYEAIDYTPQRLPHGQDHVLVRSFMAHHQGMGLLALDYLLNEQPMQKRFMADTGFQATLLLLQERVPRTGVFHPHEAQDSTGKPLREASETRLRVLTDPDAPRPSVQLLSNGRYHALLTSAGGGYSRRGDMAVTRWREDGTRDHWGNFCYLRDVDSDAVWSAAYQPTCTPVTGYEAIFSDAKAEFRGRHAGYETHLDIAISAEDDIELRRLKLSNRSRQARTIEITTYAEVVLASAVSDEMHPAFSNLFVQTELDAARQSLLCTRRARADGEPTPWMFHLVAVHDGDLDAISYETDRARFLGRGNGPRTPLAMTQPGPLSGSVGPVLDPIVAIRCRIRLEPEQTVVVDMVFGVGDSREACSALIDRYRDRRLADRVFGLAWTHSQVVRRQINASQTDAQLYERLAGLMVFAHPHLRAESEVLLQNRRGQSGLWGQSISGDLPIVLVQIAEATSIELVRQLIQAHAYWRLKGLHVDLVIWNEEQAGYRQTLQDEILGLVSASSEAHVLDRPGGVFVRPVVHISQEDRILLQTVARVVLSDQRGTLAAQLSRHEAPPRLAPLLLESPRADASGKATLAEVDPGIDETDRANARFDNGTGAFSPDGREYVITLRPGEPTPAPWSNVLANAQFGCVVSESAPGYTWFENAHEFRLTPWHNDPVADSGGEAFYLRDEDSGRVWSPTPLPCRGTGSYRTRHGFGYSVYEHVEDGIASELWVFVGLDDAVKYSWLELHNRSGRRRRLSLTGYVEWILGDLRVRSQMHVTSSIDPATGVLMARNPFNSEFGGRTCFFDGAGGDRPEARTLSADRVEFIGRNGTPAAPVALVRTHLSGRTGAGLDPCAAIQLQLVLEPDARSESVFRLGAAGSEHAAVALATRSAGLEHARDELARVRAHWRELLGGVQVHTPEPEADLLANGWLLYQTLACRQLARSGYYQSGGAFGFRDQLQDSMATVHVAPERARAHLLLCAGQQFPQGDVMHWWHPPQGRGVRTRCSDDYLWLPVATCCYLDVTRDHGVLDEVVGYIEGRAVGADEESYYDLPAASALREPLYAHCVRALSRGMQLTGERGLPLIGTGDWNDGMNRVGEAGRGESVWLGFFVFDALQRFAPVARARGDEAFALQCETTAEALRQALEIHAWDGAWYRRAWFDDGTPLGSSVNDECRIDAISQSWAVLSGAAGPERAAQAMDALDRHLVRRDAGLVQLLDPPFDSADPDPGYIRGYLPGVRENGGQYTHAAVWAGMAFAAMGDPERAWEVARLINPVNHARDPAATATYKAEPYVMAADVYAVPPHVGRGGWTWYTGSAGWMLRLLTESLLGLERRGDTLQLTPCIPPQWPGYRVDYRFGASVYRIEVIQVDGEGPTLVCDGEEQPGLGFVLVDDGRDHAVALSWPRGTPRR